MTQLSRTLPQAPRPRLEQSRDPNTQRLLRYIEDLQKQLNESYRLIAQAVSEGVQSGTLAQRPPAGITNRIYFASDQVSGARFYFDTGTAWVGQ